MSGTVNHATYVILRRLAGNRAALVYLLKHGWRDWSRYRNIRLVGGEVYWDDTWSNIRVDDACVAVYHRAYERNVKLVSLASTPTSPRSPQPTTDKSQ